MFSLEFIEYIDDALAVGNRMFSNDARRFVYSKDKNYYHLLNFEDDTVFLDSLLLSYFLNESKDTTLDQILFTKLITPTEIEVISDDNGTIYIPDLGYFLTPFVRENLTLKPFEKSFKIYKATDEVSFKFIPIYYIPNTKVEIPPFQLPYTAEVFRALNPANPNVEVKSITTLHSAKVVDAFKILEDNFPVYYQWLLNSMKKIQVFKNTDIWSFAAVKSYGVSYLSAHENRSILFFLEDIIHQCAHNIFFAVTYFDRDELFKISPDDNIDSFNEDGDHRDVYGVFHGLFTQSCISLFFDLCLEKQLFSGKEKFEVIGRLADNMKRWDKMINTFSQGDIFTEKGEQFFDEFKTTFDTINKKYAHFLDNFDTSNQPYIFCFEKFYEVNSKKLNMSYAKN